MIGRRGLLAGLLFAPAIIRTAGLLMPIKPIAFVPVFHSGLTSVEQIASKMLSLMAKHIEPSIIEAMTRGVSGGVLTRVDDAGCVVVRFVPDSDIYRTVFG